jgi:uncharacterized protein YndB with AHSA1/START domain
MRSKPAADLCFARSKGQDVWTLPDTFAVTTIAQLDALPRQFRKYNKVLCGPGTPWMIPIRAVICADARRIFQTLTAPEYLELWISLSADDSCCRLNAMEENDGYRLDHYRHGQQDIMIRCKYHVFRRRKLLFTWEVTRNAGSTKSLVLIQLRGNFASTTMEVDHRGTSRPEDHLWMGELWRRSIPRLTKLFSFTNPACTAHLSSQDAVRSSQVTGPRVPVDC